MIAWPWAASAQASRPSFFQHALRASSVRSAEDPKRGGSAPRPTSSARRSCRCSGAPCLCCPVSTPKMSPSRRPSMSRPSCEELEPSRRAVGGLHSSKRCWRDPRAPPGMVHSRTPTLPCRYTTQSYYGYACRVVFYESTCAGCACYWLSLFHALVLVILVP